MLENTTTTDTEVQASTTTNTTDTVLEPSSVESRTKLSKEEKIMKEATEKPFQTSYNGAWMNAINKPSEAQIAQIKETSRVRLVRESYKYFNYSNDSLDLAVSKFLDEDKLSSTGIVFTSDTDTQQADLTDFILKGNTNIVRDIIQPEFGIGKITHTHYFDATYTTNLRNKESYKILFVDESIFKIIEKIAYLEISKIGMLKALTNFLVESQSSIKRIKKIEKKLIDYFIVKEEHTFSSNVIKAQAQAKQQNKNISENYTEEKRALEIMKDYALLNNQGKVQIINTTKPGLVASTKSGLRDLFSNQLINGENPVNIWMNSPKRPIYTNTKFDPSNSSKDTAYNLFKGFAHPAKQLIDITMFKDFVKNIICSTDDKMYNIVWSFLAQMIQDPKRKMGTALVLLSGKATGKSTFVKVIGELLKGYFYQSADNKRLLGEFNTHLETTLLFYANELTFTDNKRVVAKLKNVITEDNFTYEIKGGATYSAPNLVRVIIDSNEDIAVVQTADERRFIYPVVSEEMIGNTEYFNKLHSLFEAEGFYESLMHDLMNHDYQPWEHYLKTPPKNEVTEEQVVSNFSDVEAFWMYCLEEGKIPYVEYEVTYDDMLNITNEALYQSYVKHTRANGRKVTLDSANFGKALKKHVLKDNDLDKKGKITISGVRKNSRLYNTRATCVEHFTKLKKLNNMDYDGAAWEVYVND